jgi:mRNA-degrading endonuclease toxin of MazEF toxin-antitoxin module
VTDQVRAVSKERLLRRIGVVSGDDLAAVEIGVREILEL